eukprot:m.307643 g.307643  ORF g.307643 m.307643 type:complete len:169 (+) comp42574_c0_seq1:147-653(+)
MKIASASVVSGPRPVRNSHWCLKNYSPVLIGIVLGVLFTASGLTLVLTTELSNSSVPSWESNDADVCQSIFERRLASWLLLGVGIPLFVVCVVIVYVVKSRQQKKNSDERRMSYRDWIRAKKANCESPAVSVSRKLQLLAEIESMTTTVELAAPADDGPPPYYEAFVV